MTAQIVRLSHDNSDLLTKLADQVFDFEIKEDSLREFLDCPRHIMFLAVESDQVVGMASALEYFHPDKKSQLWINEVGISPDFRNRGIGRKLVEAMIELARERACIGAWIGTSNENLPAQRCFSSVTGVSEGEPFLLYEWELH